VTAFEQLISRRSLMGAAQSDLGNTPKRPGTGQLELVESLDLAEIRGQLKQRIKALQKYDLLVIDELGYLPVVKKSAHNLFQLINTLYEYRSLILTTNKHFTEWADFFADDAVAVPIVDRIIHHSHVFLMGGDSYRLKQNTDR
jgi:DNA replication protein DnaC